MKDDGTWLALLLAAGVILYLVFRNAATSSAASAASAAPVTHPASTAAVLTAAAPLNPLIGTNVQPGVAPATQNAVSQAAKSSAGGASGSAGFPAGVGVSPVVVAPDIWSTDEGSAGSRYQMGIGPALID